MLGFLIGFYFGTILFRATSGLTTVLVWSGFGLIGSGLAVTSTSAVFSALPAEWGSLARIAVKALKGTYAERRVEGRFIVYVFQPTYKRVITLTVIGLAAALFLGLPKPIIASIAAVICIAAVAVSHEMFHDSLRSKSKRVVRRKDGFEKCGLKCE